MRKYIDRILWAVAIMDAINTVVQTATKVSSLGLSPNTWLVIGLVVFFCVILILIARSNRQILHPTRKVDISQTAETVISHRGLTGVMPNVVLTKEQQDLLDFYETQKVNSEQYIIVEITNVICYTKATTPYLIFQFMVRNFLPVSFKLVRINAGGTLNSGKLGNLPSLKERLDQKFQPCGEGRFNFKLEINGTGLPVMLEAAAEKMGSVQWIIQGEWHIEIYGETRLWRGASSLTFSKIPQLVAGN
jgi:hypothetical protein